MFFTKMLSREAENVVPMDIGNYFDETNFPQPAQNLETHAHAIDDYRCVFEPTFQRGNNRLVHVGFRAIGELNFDASKIGDFLDSAKVGSISIKDAVGLGMCQMEVLRAHLKHYFDNRDGKDRLCLQVDISDFENNRNSLNQFKYLLARAEKLGMPRENFELELSSSSEVDDGVFYTVAAEFKRAGVRIALVGVDADHFNMNRIFMVQPDVVKFSNSWCSFGSVSRQYGGWVSNCVKQMQQMDIIAAMTGLESGTDLEFAIEAGFTRMSGPYLGVPRERLLSCETISVE